MASGLSRRAFISGAALSAAVGAGARGGSGLSKVLASTERSRDRALVVLFLRGGADGLSMVPPVGDAEYYRLRPTLALPGADDRTAPVGSRAVPLDDRFGLHPSLRMLEGLYREGMLAVVHAVGSGDQSRSHFEAMAVMERGLSGTTDGPSSGWLARALEVGDSDGASPLRAIAFTDTMPDILRGLSSASVMRSIADYRLRGDDGFRRSIQTLYSRTYGDGSLAHLQAAGQSTLAVLDAIASLSITSYRPAAGVTYPEGPVGNGLRQTACLIKGRVGLEVAFLDMTGWDTHVAQGRDSGWMPSRLSELGAAIRAFASDLGSELDRVTCIVMTEFGRRVYENGGLGTDHGRGSCMLVVGAGVNGGRVHGRWPGLAKHQLEPPGDLAVTSDYRSVLFEALMRTQGVRGARAAFPGYAHAPVGVIES